MGLYKWSVTGVITRPSEVKYNPFTTGCCMFLRPTNLYQHTFLSHLVMQLKSSSISLETFMFLKSSGLYLGCELVSCVGWEVGQRHVSVGRHSRDPLCIVCFPTYVSKRHVQDYNLYITSYSYIHTVVMTIIYLIITIYSVYGYTAFKLSSIITKRYTYINTDFQVLIFLAKL